jgi:competence protein ComEA
MSELEHRANFVAACSLSVLWRILLCGLLVLLFMVSGSARQKQPEEKPHEAKQEATQLPHGPGRQTFLQICGNCHSPDNVIGKAYAEAAWTQVVGTMIQHGAKGTNEQFAAIVRYLGENFGPAPHEIDVNKATVLNLRNWLHLTEKQADAVVSCRMKNGDFKSLDDLKKVPGITPHFWDLRKDRLTF